MLPLSIEPISPEWTQVGVGLVITSAVWTFKSVRAWLSFLHFKSGWVKLLICFVAPSEFVVVFWFVRTVTFDTLGSLNLVWKHSMTPFLAILALGNFWIHVGSLNCHNVFANIETSVDKYLGFAAALNILYVYPDDKYVWFQQNFDNSGFRC